MKTSTIADLMNEIARIEDTASFDPAERTVRIAPLAAQLRALRHEQESARAVRRELCAAMIGR